MVWVYCLIIIPIGIINIRFVFLYTEPEAEPSEWLKGISYNYLSRFNIPAELQGKYTLCVGLTDKTKNNEAAIDLAVSGNLKIGKWIFVVELEL